MATERNRDPWVNVCPPRDFHADEVVSALQKEMQRGHTENAALLAYEMATTDPELQACLKMNLQDEPIELLLTSPLIPQAHILRKEVILYRQMAQTGQVL